MHEKCDFCSARYAQREYDAGSTMLLDPTQRPDMPLLKASRIWASCEICGDLIDAGNWPALVERVKQKMLEIYAEFVPAIIEPLTALIDEQYRQLEQRGLVRVDK